MESTLTRISSAVLPVSVNPKLAVHATRVWEFPRAASHSVVKAVHCIPTSIAIRLSQNRPSQSLIVASQVPVTLGATPCRSVLGAGRRSVLLLVCQVRRAPLLPMVIWRTYSRKSLPNLITMILTLKVTSKDELIDGVEGSVSI